MLNFTEVVTSCSHPFQHAADERIRLEEMRQKVHSGELMSITYLEEEKELVLPEIEYQLLCNYAESIQHWGWKCNIFCQESGSFSKNLDLLNDQASHLRLLAVIMYFILLSDQSFLILPYQSGMADSRSKCILDFRQRSYGQFDLLGTLCSGCEVVRRGSARISGTGAIMFGDKLLPSECSLIVEELKRTSLCFQCAHGRPTTAPLVNLKALHRRVLQLGSSHKGSKMTWHGLHRNDINVARAKHRLDAARGC
ncbi:hypothetical protein KSS87_015650 [Heliosperma pusillum]|nr:hypothetical protein KSS87_015650 [Heliosperma pusillum]